MRKKRRIIFLAGFLFSIPLALTSYVNSSMLKEYLTVTEVGIFYTLASILAIIFLFQMPKILTKYGNKKATLYFGGIALASLICISFANIKYLLLPAFAIFFISTVLILASLDIFVKDFSKNTSIGRLRGVYLTFTNLSWVLAQTISGSIISKSSFQGIYLFSALFIILMMLSIQVLLKNFKDPKYHHIPFLKTVKTFIRSKKLSKVYMIQLILRFFFAWMMIYTPIYLVESIGFDWSEIGTIFSIMLLPFVILTYPVSKISDKLGEKKLMLLGFAIMALFTIIIPLIGLKSLVVFATILFMTRVGAAMIEAMSEIYFFKIVKEEDVDEIAFFKNAYPMSFVIAPAFGSLTLILLHKISMLYYVLTMVVLFGLWITLRLRDIK